MLVAQLCLTLCNTMDCSPPALSMEFSRQEYWSSSHSLLQGMPREMKPNTSITILNINGLKLLIKITKLSLWKDSYILIKIIAPFSWVPRDSIPQMPSSVIISSSQWNVRVSTASKSFPQKSRTWLFSHFLVIHFLPRWQKGIRAWPCGGESAASSERWVTCRIHHTWGGRETTIRAPLCRLALCWGRAFKALLLLSPQSCPTLCDPMDCSMPGFPGPHQLLELAQTHVHWVSDAFRAYPGRLWFCHNLHFRLVLSLELGESVGSSHSSCHGLTRGFLNVWCMTVHFSALISHQNSLPNFFFHTSPEHLCSLLHL